MGVYMADHHQGNNFDKICMRIYHRLKQMHSNLVVSPNSDVREMTNYSTCTYHSGQDSFSEVI